ncbi:MAG: hypothetical protein JSS16_06360 [Proteobacteria bacterium]|uniref:hypothetical protein n=1 Tax=Rudaea sp. TaxID=2136325 RepID=UPI001D20CF3E|nr:hypothetical protein [Pseudomonadota bacterium]MBS0568707.1 hypothetical protein [Pseudomonadota bacterium]
MLHKFLSSLAPLLLASSVALLAPPASAAVAVPSYPNAVNKNPELPRGSPMFQLETADAASAVDAWYGAHLPKSCTHQTAQGGAKYACPNASIMITPHDGKTLITHMSPMGGMFGH